jgi:small subunit ribosomal protein S18
MARNNMRTTKRAPKDLGRRIKKKPCQLCKDHVDWVDYKNANMLKRYMSERGKIRARRVSGNCEQHQRDIAEAIKTARELALLPYTQRTVTERRGGGRGRDREGGRGRGGSRDQEEPTLASAEFSNRSGSRDDDRRPSRPEAPTESTAASTEAPAPSTEAPAPSNEAPASSTEAPAAELADAEAEA